MVLIDWGRGVFLLFLKNPRFKPALVHELNKNCHQKPTAREKEMMLEIFREFLMTKKWRIKTLSRKIFMSINGSRTEMSHQNRWQKCWHVFVGNPGTCVLFVLLFVWNSVFHNPPKRSTCPNAPHGRSTNATPLWSPKFQIEAHPELPSVFLNFPPAFLGIKLCFLSKKTTFFAHEGLGRLFWKLTHFRSFFVEWRCNLCNTAPNFF